jgi:hypothetical protein
MKHPKQSHNLLHLAILLACCLSTIHAQEQPEIKWPEGALEKIEALLAIKKEAMKTLGMRSIEGELGRRAEAVMNQIAPLVSDPGFLMALQTIETQDIRAKIALWAADRQRRPGEYARFAKWYVNCPNPLGDINRNPFELQTDVPKPNDGSESLDEWTEYFYRSAKKRLDPEYLATTEPMMFRPRIWEDAKPNPMDKEDLVEANRWIMEYCYFVPPAGLAFGTDIYRAQLAYALLKTPFPEKSLIVFLEDGKLQTFDMVAVDPAPRNWLWIGKSDRGGFFNNEEAFWYLINLPNNDSFRGLALLSKEEDKLEYIRESFARVWNEENLGRNLLLAFDYDSGWHLEDMMPHHAKWMTLASLDWQEPHEIELAQWLKTTRVQKSPPQENPFPPPFGPGEK